MWHCTTIRRSLTSVRDDVGGVKDDVGGVKDDVVYAAVIRASEVGWAKEHCDVPTCDRHGHILGGHAVLCPPYLLAQDY